MIKSNQEYIDQGVESAHNDWLKHELRIATAIVHHGRQAYTKYIDDKCFALTIEIYSEDFLIA